MSWTSKEAAIATKGQVFSDWQGGKLVFDSRLIEAGDIFIALPGAVSDGHDHVLSALEKGANAAIVSRIPEGLNNKDKILLVDNTLDALLSMASHKRSRSKAKFIAVTGSVGKTSTKELLHLAFSNYGKVFASRGNYNNFLGVPINLASLPDDAEYAIFELGMNHAGEITPLSNMVKPHIAIITAVENIHRANFDSIDDIALAKAEIFDGLLPKSLVIINSLSNCYPLLLEKAKANLNIDKIISVGENSQIVSYEVNNNKTKANLNILGQAMAIDIDYILGVHQISNMITVLTCIACLGLNPLKSISALEGFKLPRGRGLVSTIKVDNKQITLIDDSYNAGPVSVKAALKNMSYYSGRKIAILGDMGEMGPKSLEFHLALIDDIIANNIDKVICFGKQMAIMQDKLPKDKQIGSYFDLKDLAKDLPDKLLAGDVLLIKGSFYLTRLYEFTKHLSEGTLHVL